MSVLDTVQETLFQQFLAGADPSRRLEVAGDASSVSSRVEDLPWWKYQRAIALWYCEWLDTYYDSGERRFLWRDELTQGFEAANLEELKEAAQRMRLDLPEHEEITAEPLTGEAAPPCEASEVETETHGALGDDGDWHVAALAAAVEDEDDLAWRRDELTGHFTHWAPEVGRLFLWQEDPGVLYESRGRARYAARWALAPALALTAADASRGSARLVLSSLRLGSVECQEEPCWELPGLQPAHARVFLQENTWWLEALHEDAETLLNGQRLQTGAAQRIMAPALLRLGAEEFFVDLPETPAGAAPSAEPAAERAAPRAPVVSRSFVPRQEDERPLPPLTGTARAKELNRALRRLVCGGAGQINELDRCGAAARAERYEDRAEKRRRLHPVEWEPPAPGPTSAAPNREAEALPLPVPVQVRRFTEA
ncbi:unnamed protein product [Durusdinium trenchii]|uniref:FHA domain-containing protein n=1 Tax=Durusdinium trenchii TaxID=1381693 RepID=A0ABP0S7P2_9DINO